MLKLTRTQIWAVMLGTKRNRIQGSERNPWAYWLAAVFAIGFPRIRDLFIQVNFGRIIFKPWPLPWTARLYTAASTWTGTGFWRQGGPCIHGDPGPSYCHSFIQCHFSFIWQMWVIHCNWIDQWNTQTRALPHGAYTLAREVHKTGINKIHFWAQLK